MTIPPLPTPQAYDWVQIGWTLLALIGLLVAWPSLRRRREDLRYLRRAGVNGQRLGYARARYLVGRLRFAKVSVALAIGIVALTPAFDHARWKLPLILGGLLAIIAAEVAAIAADDRADRRLEHDRADRGLADDREAREA